MLQAILTHAKILSPLLLVFEGQLLFLMISFFSFFRSLRQSRFWGTVSYFTFVGPPLGNILIVSGLFISSLFNGGSLTNIGGFFLIGVVGFFFSYILGGIPALLLGIMCALKPSFFLSRPGIVTLGGIGASLSMLMALFVFSRESETFAWPLAIVLCLTGGVAAMLTGFAYKRFLTKHMPHLLLESPNIK